MANANRAAGLIPVNYLNGARWNGQANIYYIPQSDTNAYAVGDPLATAVGSADLNGVSAVTLATAGTGQPVRGVLVGVGTGEGMMANPQNLNQIFVPATKTRPYYVMVVDDPNVIFEIQANDNHYGQADIGNNCNLLAGVNNGYTSGWQIDDSVASTGYTSAGQLRLLGTSRRLANVLGQSHCAFLVLLRTHELGSAGGGSGSGGGASFSLDSNGNPVGFVTPNGGVLPTVFSPNNAPLTAYGQPLTQGQMKLTANVLKTPSVAFGVLLNYQAGITSAASTITPRELDVLIEPLERLMRSSVWAKLIDLWVPCGAAAAAGYVKLKYTATSGQSVTTTAPPTYTPTTGFTGDGATTFLTTGFKPATEVATAGEWGFGVYVTNQTTSGLLGGTTASNSYLAYKLGASSRINGNAVITTGQFTRFNAIQQSGGNTSVWNNGYVQASAASAAGTLDTAALTLLNSNAGSFFSSQTVAGYATWTPGLTAGEMLLLTNFFDSVNAGLWRNTWVGSLVACGDSNVSGTGVTSAQRFSALLSGTLGLTENNQGLASSGMSSHDNGGMVGGRWVTNFPVANSAIKAGTLYLIALGTNDARYAVPIANFAADYETWLNYQFQNGIDPSCFILMAAGAATDALSVAAGAAVFIAQNAAIKGLASKYGCGFFDTYALTLGQASYFQGDALHYSVAGHIAISNAILAYIATTYPRSKIQTNVIG